MHDAVLHQLTDAQTNGVDEVRPHGAQRELARQRQQHADGQRPERFDGQVGHHTVIDRAQVERDDQRSQIDQNSDQRELAKQLPVGKELLEDPPPWFLLDAGAFFRDLAAIDRIDGAEAQQPRAGSPRHKAPDGQPDVLARLRSDAGAAACWINRLQGKRAASVHQQDAGRAGRAEGTRRYGPPFAVNAFPRKRYGC